MKDYIELWQLQDSITTAVNACGTRDFHRIFCQTMGWSVSPNNIRQMAEKGMETDPNNRLSRKTNTNASRMRLNKGTSGRFMTLFQ